MSISRRKFFGWVIPSSLLSIAFGSRAKDPQIDIGALTNEKKDSIERNNIFSVDMFGAKGDGKSVATKAFVNAAKFSPDGVYVPTGTYLLPDDLPGKFYGPGRRIISVDDKISIPFSNPAQTHGNLFYGYDAGKLFKGDDISGLVVGLGPSACRNVTTGKNIVGIGASVISGDSLNDSLTDNSPCIGTELVAIGVNAVKKAITLHNSIGIGRDALNENKFGSFNIGIGSSALQQLHTGFGNIAIGRAAGMRSGITANNKGARLSFNVVNGSTFIGNSAGRENKTGNNNTYVGNNSGRGLTSKDNPFTGTSIGNNNVALGANSLNKIMTGSNNVSLGSSSMRDLQDGNGNIFIGCQSGETIQKANNVLIISNRNESAFLYGEMIGPDAKASFLQLDGSFLPAKDNHRSLGSGDNRWSNIYACSSTINTSDGRLKTDVTAIDELEKRVAMKLKNLIKRYRFIDAIGEKGDDARWHFGIIAQDVAEAFESEGLDASHYGLFCHDKWGEQYAPVLAEKTVIDKETGLEEIIKYDTGERKIVKEAGERFGIRYDELLCFIIATI